MEGWRAKYLTLTRGFGAPVGVPTHERDSPKLLRAVSGSTGTAPTQCWTFVLGRLPPHARSREVLGSVGSVSVVFASVDRFGSIDISGGLRPSGPPPEKRLRRTRRPVSSADSEFAREMTQTPPFQSSRERC
eukprot:11781075-Alexandrium_andersonii.AAC.1